MKFSSGLVNQWELSSWERNSYIALKLEIGCGCRLTNERKRKKNIRIERIRSQGTSKKSETSAIPIERKSCSRSENRVNRKGDEEGALIVIWTYFFVHLLKPFQSHWHIFRRVKHNSSPVELNVCSPRVVHWLDRVKTESETHGSPCRNHELNFGRTCFRPRSSCNTSRFLETFWIASCGTARVKKKMKSLFEPSPNQLLYRNPSSLSMFSAFHSTNRQSKRGQQMCGELLDDRADREKPTVFRSFTWLSARLRSGFEIWFDRVLAISVCASLSLSVWFAMKSNAELMDLDGIISFTWHKSLAARIDLLTLSFYPPIGVKYHWSFVMLWRRLIQLRR